MTDRDDGFDMQRVIRRRLQWRVFRGYTVIVAGLVAVAEWVRRAV